jgi:2-polyprenyl-3-methyl-5-hydroxy-6-metoxy-1,4-benzoquinol methylase
MTDETRRRHWDERHGGGDFEGTRPERDALVGAVANLRPGTALELAAGSGTNAIWLASQGWRVTAVDWSPRRALANARAPPPPEPASRSSGWSGTS